jgi:peptide/nickel transport system ATP-binding protein
MPAPVMELKNLVKEFDTRRGPITAVDNVSVTLDKGDILCLVGESGSGKTTVARMAGGLIKPTSGVVNFEGKDIAHMSKSEFKEYRKAVQIIHQDPYASLNPVHTIGDTLRAPLLHHKLVKGRREATERANWSIAGQPRTSSTSSRTSFRVASGSGSRSPGRWP